MFDVVRLVHLSPAGGSDAANLMTELRAAAAAGVARRVLVQPTLPGVRNGGDVVVHLRFDEPADWSGCASRVDAVLADPLVTHVDGAEYEGGVGGFAEPRSPGSVYRVLLLRVAPGTARTVVDRFEADLLRMPGPHRARPYLSQLLRERARLIPAAARSRRAAHRGHA